ncbi:MAG: replicative DNA helicase [Flavobacteriales bacterium]|nr:replicative DNA helicase [Flavobacteriales bacterium]
MEELRTKKNIDRLNRPQSFASAAIEGGKLPPQAIELEEAVLGAILMDSKALNEVIDALRMEAFYDPRHQQIFEAVTRLFNESKPIDILTVTEKVREMGHLDAIGGPFYISQLTNKVASTANAEVHARIITQKFILRELIRISSETIKEAYDETTDVFDLLDKTESRLFTVSEGNLKKSYDAMSALMKEAIHQIEEVMKMEEGVSGVPSGFKDLDKVTSGWQRSDMIVIAARPGMGKTAFVLSMARNTAVEYQRPVAVFSLEMSSVQLVQRLISSETEISSEKLRKGTLRDDEFAHLHARIGRLSKAPIFIDDTPALSVFELRAKCRRLKQQHNIELIIIDYLQLMTAGGDKGNREQEISTISRSIKSIAKELNVPVIALSQLNRSVETRGGDKKPQLSDLRESGAIEQDADLVSFIYRPEYYGIHEYEDGLPTKGVGEFIIAKHRNGALDNIKLGFRAELAKFTDLQAFDFHETLDPLSPDMGFSEAGPTITLQSKMNDDWSPDASSSEDELDF